MRKNGTRPVGAGVQWKFGIFALLVLMAAGSMSMAGEKRVYQIRGAEETEYVRKSVLSRLVPLLPNVLQEAGMPRDQAKAVCQRFQHDTMVNTHRGQIDHDHARAAEILAALPEGVRQKFLQLSYQWTGPSSLWRDEVAETLMLSPDQKQRVGEILVDFLEQMAPVNRADFSYKMTIDQQAAYRVRTVEIEAERDRRLLDVLTPDQREAWRKLIGSPSKALQDFRDYCAAHQSP